MIVISVMFLVTACSNFNFPGVYRIAIEQGNIIEEEMITQLQPGMTRDQVRYVMGSPLIIDTFHQSRWDYHYQIRRGNDELEKQSLTLLFDGDLLASIQRNSGSSTTKKHSDKNLSNEKIEQVLSTDMDT